MNFCLSFEFTELLALGNERTEFKFYFVKMDQNNKTYIYSLSITVTRISKNGIIE